MSRLQAWLVAPTNFMLAAVAFGAAVAVLLALSISVLQRDWYAWSLLLGSGGWLLLGIGLCTSAAGRMLVPAASGRRLSAIGVLGAFGAVAGLVVLLAVVLTLSLAFGPPEL